MVSTALAGCGSDPPSAAVGIVVDACAPGDGTGSGALVGPGLVLTAAHVVAGATDVRVVRGHRSVAAEVVGFDPEMDLAYLAVDAIGGTPLPVASDPVDAGATGVAYAMRGGSIEALPVTVSRRVQISTEDIYVEGATVRPGYVLDADIRPGDSGAAVVVDGEVIGVLWARSRDADGRSYAIDPRRAGALLREQLRTGVIGPGIDPARCR